MRGLIIFLVVLSSGLISAQENIGATTFHRMLIFNEKQELLVVKLKNHDLWVTPGLYQSHKQTLKQGIDSIASTYGMKTSNIQLRGIYGLINPAKSTFSTRNIFTMRLKSELKYLPDIIEDFRWVSLNQADKLINIPHINEFIKDIIDNPDNVRSGTVEIKVIEIRRTHQIIEKFYSITNN